MGVLAPEPALRAWEFYLRFLEGLISPQGVLPTTMAGSAHALGMVDSGNRSFPTNPGVVKRSVGISSGSGDPSGNHS